MQRCVQEGAHECVQRGTYGEDRGHQSPFFPQDAHLSEVNAVCFGPNSSLLATGGADRLIHLWNVVGGEGSSLWANLVLSLQTLPSACSLVGQRVRSVCVSSHVTFFVASGQMTLWQEFWAELPTCWNPGLQDGEG